MRFRQRLRKGGFMKVVIILVIFIIILLCFKNKIRIKFKTFLKRGFAPKRGKFGVYCYCGKQGQGKTYSVVEYLLKNKDKKIYTNLSTLENIDFIQIHGFNDLLKLRDEHDCIIFYDEIFTALTKTTKMTEEVLDFLSQMRKRRIIFLTTAQEWLEINITLRRYCRYQINCRMLNFLGLGILIKQFNDAENMKWSVNDNEYVAPLIETTVSKCNLDVANSYDTFEQIITNNQKKR